MGNPTVAWNPQPMAQLQARYKEAVRELVMPEEILAHVREPPSSFPQHVFDTEYGLRLIVSRERLPGVMQPRVVIHISASVHSTEQVIMAARASGKHAMAWTVGVWQEISGDKREPEYIGTSPNGIPHWIVEVGH